MNHYPRSFRRTCRPSPLRHGGRGVVLLEALVGILIFTVGVLGLVGVQVAMTKAQTAANFRAEAAQLASDVVARMWLDNAKLSLYESEATCKAHPSCNEWMKRVAARLPGGVPPTVTKSGGAHVIVITWIVPGETDNGGKHTFSTSTSVGL